MQSSIRENQWPTVDGPENLAKIGERVALAVAELEESWNRDALQDELGCARKQALLGQQIIACYRNLSIPRTDSLWRHRKRWMENALAELRGAWSAPVAVFRASATDGAGNEVVIVDGEEVAVRAEQIHSVRFWRVCIQPDNNERALRLANTILRRASERLVCDMDCVSRLCQAHFSGRLPHAHRIHWGVHGLGIAFERLIADILNEKALCAHRAPLREDLFEWTDLRVRYPALQRGHGARVQVKLIGDEALENLKVSHWPHREGYVIVSPVRLAQYAESFLGSLEHESAGADFWNSIGGQPADVRELAWALNSIFTKAIANSRPHPLGPMVQVPAPVRVMIQSYVRTTAFSATKQMRESIKDRAGLVPPWRSRRIRGGWIQNVSKPRLAAVAAT